VHRGKAARKEVASLRDAQEVEVEPIEEAKEKAKAALEYCLEEGTESEQAVAAANTSRSALEATLSQEEAVDQDIDDLRCMLKGRLFEAAQDESLDAAIASMSLGKSGNPTTWSPQPPQAQDQLAIVERPVATAKQGESSAWMLMKALSQRDQRIGELIALIASTEQRIADRDDDLKQIEQQISSVKAESAHFDMDIEWHKRALVGAEERSAELEADPEATTLKLKQGSLERNVASSRSAISTAATSTQRAWTPQTPRSKVSLTPLQLSSP
jgi:hypothetical protein